MLPIAAYNAQLKRLNMNGKLWQLIKYPAYFRKIFLRNYYKNSHRHQRNGSQWTAKKATQQRVEHQL